MNAPVLSRRALLGGLGLGFAILLDDAVRILPAIAAEKAGFAPNIWLTIGADNRVTIISPSTEMGQGSSTSVPMMLADELDADWALVDFIQPDFNDKRFANPAFKFYQQAASTTVQNYFLPVRLAGRQARRVLLDAAAAKWNVPVDQLATEPGIVVHRASGRRLSYGQVAAFATMPATMPDVTEADLKPVAARRMIGGNVPRRDVPSKTNGSARYAIDVSVPGMVSAALLPAPYDGAKPLVVKDAAALAVKGVSGIAKIRDGVAVIADTFANALAGKALLEVEWSKDAPAAGYDSEKAVADYMRTAADLSRPGVVNIKEGDPDARIAAGGTVIGASYGSRPVYHAQIEPLNAIASVGADGKSAEIWVGTQSPSLIMMGVAGVLQTTPDKIIVHPQLLGGGFGRRTGPDFAINAALLSRQLGKPVKLIYDRTTDFHIGQFRPPTGHRIDAALSTDGVITAWRHRIAGESVIGYKQGEAQMTRIKGNDTVVTKGSEIAHYGIADRRVDYLRQTTGLRVCYLRGVGANPNCFAIESFVDEIAHRLKRDPLAYRLAMTAKGGKEGARATALLTKVGAMSGWGQPVKAKAGSRAAGPVRAKGVAMGEKDGTMFASVAEISLDRKSGEIRVHRVWVAVDCGFAVQPFNVKAQTEGGVQFALGPALREAITIKDGHVQEDSFPDYLVARFADAPEVFVEIVPSDHPISGGGEAGVPALAPAIANALFTLAGARVRELPLSPERVLAALNKKA